MATVAVSGCKLVIMSVKVSEGSNVRVQARRGDHLRAYVRLAD